MAGETNWTPPDGVMARITEVVVGKDELARIRQESVATAPITESRDYGLGDLSGDVGRGLVGVVKGVAEPILILYDFGQMAAGLVKHAVSGRASDLDVDYTSATGQRLATHPEDRWRTALKPAVAVGTVGASVLFESVATVLYVDMPSNQARSHLVQTATALTAGAAIAKGAEALSNVRTAKPAGEGEMSVVVDRLQEATFAPGEGAGGVIDASRLRRQVMELPPAAAQTLGAGKLIGPEAVQPGSAINLTNDVVFLMRDQMAGEAFFFGAHATRDSLSFFADFDATIPISARKAAVQMWKAGYRGGDVILFACESGENLGLLRSLRSELVKLLSSERVGDFAAPSEAILGNGQITRGGHWNLIDPATNHATLGRIAE